MKYPLFFSILLMLSCNNSETKETQVSQETQEAKVGSDSKPQSLESQFQGIYHGIQESYFMKNQYGDDMIVNGNKVSVPGIDYKFILKQDGVANLQQTSLEDNSRYYYDGSYTILKEDANTLNIECNLSDGKSSNPSYTITIDKSSNKVTCKGSNDPAFNLEKTK